MKMVPALLATVFCVACAQLPVGEGAPTIATVEGDFCETPIIKVDADFSAANMASCTVLGPRIIEVSLVPEDTPINQSPWYAVRLSPHQAGNVTIVLQ